MILGALAVAWMPLFDCQIMASESPSLSDLGQAYCQDGVSLGGNWLHRSSVELLTYVVPFLGAAAVAAGWWRGRIALVWTGLATVLAGPILFELLVGHTLTR